MEDYLGFVRIFAGDYVPFANNNNISYAACNGGSIDIKENMALFNIIGNQFGGNPAENFQLPDLQSRIPVGADANAGKYIQGQANGQEDVTLSVDQLPEHKHQSNGLSGGLEKYNPLDNFLPEYKNPAAEFYSRPNNPLARVKMNEIVIGKTGGSQPHNNMSPFSATNFIICTKGLYPINPRNDE